MVGQRQYPALQAPHELFGLSRAVTAAYGNQTSRTIAGVTYTFVYDAENRLTGVRQGETGLAAFVYDADGQRVLGSIGGVTTVYVAGVYEYELGTGATTHYYEGNALRRSGYASDNGVFYLLQDHLHSSSATVAQTGTLAGNRNYFYPFGGNRSGAAFNGLTTKRFTGQYHEQALPGGEGLSYYGARWYDAQLGRFTTPDSIVPKPANPQDFNRYAYVNNNPLKYVDPSGHWPLSQIAEIFGRNWQQTFFGKGSVFYGNTAFYKFLTSSQTKGRAGLRAVWGAAQIARGMYAAGLPVPDAITIRLTGNAAAVVQPGLAVEAVVNFRSGELSYFTSGSAGAGPAAGASADVGVGAVYDLPDNFSYRGYFGSVKIDAKYWGGVTGEFFTAMPIPDFPYGNTSRGPDGIFLGGGVGAEASFTVNMSYAFEIRRESDSGTAWLPQLKEYHPIRDAGEILYQAYWGLGLLLFGELWTEYAK